MTRIHASAVVDSKAEIASDVEIGPYSVIGPNVKIGAGSKIGSHTVIEGYTTIGKENNFAHFAAIGGAPQDMKYRGEPTQLIIGDRNTIREFTTIHTGTSQDEGITRIGDDNCSSNAQIAGHVKVSDWAIMGGMSGVHQFVRIGQHAMLGGASALVQDIPPFVIAAGDKASPHGINVEGLKRRGFSTETISALRQAYKVLYKDGLSFEEAKVEIQKMATANSADAATAEKLTEFHDFIAASTRGIIR
ncbi:MAG: acyl-[acyl-carrier-protein]--UDP-N-acetylglucosamine O-acyltransferase [Polynucleobacter sp. 35-46-207]|nr:MAG: acyl-[acyl-carrier-protein]--UDP-N-acetylglucosamine O-acyltransferase [Polynucleobacter sp. 35-46-207]